ncbi:MAG TPA: CopG family ribbon-helix-helix protein [Terriglobia bacterium]|nr:CopG family ribbon-helix-helix protein [Terriglobia bacterium]
MANTNSRPFSVRLKPAIRKKLSKLANRTGRSSNYLVADAVEVYISDQERLLADIRRGKRQMDSGHYVKHEDMKAWLLSWGTDHELRPPKCVCGKCHDGKTL